ncbi:hypothetical protein HDC92_000590 [Pedobacter sp. AK017]|uniref:hypothetical protein n=1 Tax=Pedobacter sp. AK017 TaxID=2723073 RepID=UPI001611419D|nr:hypothetical protein [Pedobacter sp. AK017]MBB5436926.1 hypothetical protein [Pedobacter sp. AK017]
MKKIILLVFICQLIACKKGNKKAPAEDPKNRRAIVFVNASDPRFAEIETEENERFVFYGERAANGSPKKLTGYSRTLISDSTKLDYVSIDNQGRYSNIQLATGEKIHFDYSLPDLVQFTISGPDGVSNVVKASVNDKASANQISSLKTYSNTAKTYVGTPHAPAIRAANAKISSASVPGGQKKIVVKVVAKNDFNQVEKNVIGEESAVTVCFNGQPYGLPAAYDESTGYYSLPLLQAGFNYEDPDAISKTIDIIKTGLDIACSKTNSGNSGQDKSILKLIAASVCPIPHPYAKAICLASTGLIFACKAINFLTLLNKSVYQVGTNTFVPSNNATVKVFSNHYKYGLAASMETTVSAIATYQGAYDLQIVHDYNEIITPPPVNDEYCRFVINYKQPYNGLTEFKSEFSSDLFIVEGDVLANEPDILGNVSICNGAETQTGNGVVSFIRSIKKGKNIKITYYQRNLSCGYDWTSLGTITCK